MTNKIRVVGTRFAFASQLAEHSLISPRTFQLLLREQLMNPSVPRASIPASDKLHVPPGARSCLALATELAEEMATAWQRGDYYPAGNLITRHPEISSDGQATSLLIYEEMCLRRDAGEEVETPEMVSRYSPWRPELSILFRNERLLEDYPIAFPQIGDLLGDFRIVAELSRGVAGRVYLATQDSLASRPVVLKVTARSEQEYLALARLQHTHIVPLYQVQDFLAQELRVLCMPYLGGATIAQLMERVIGLPPERRTGQDLLAALDREQAALPIALDARGLDRQFFARASYTEAVCWIGACLADALQFAHERGLVHLDLKPANILLTADGQPMLLDFHLAHEPVPSGTSPPEWLGGTAGYMSPEHISAMAAMRWRRAIPTSVDGRSDLYSLGLVLYELLAGPIPWPRRASPRELRQLNPEVSRRLADIIVKCLAHSPCDRYHDAAVLALDLREQVAGQPYRRILRHGPAKRWHTGIYRPREHWPPVCESVRLKNRCNPRQPSAAALRAGPVI
jgi:eukaryotic-like serine/threonine-protein kinase